MGGGTYSTLCVGVSPMKLRFHVVSTLHALLSTPLSRYAPSPSRPPENFWSIRHKRCIARSVVDRSRGIRVFLRPRPARFPLMTNLFAGRFACRPDAPRRDHRVGG